MRGSDRGLEIRGAEGCGCLAEVDLDELGGSGTRRNNEQRRENAEGREGMEGAGNAEAPALSGWSVWPAGGGLCASLQWVHYSIQ